MRRKIATCARDRDVYHMLGKRLGTRAIPLLSKTVGASTPAVTLVKETEK